MALPSLPLLYIDVAVAFKKGDGLVMSPNPDFFLLLFLSFFFSFLLIVRNDQTSRNTISSKTLYLQNENDDRPLLSCLFDMNSCGHCLPTVKLKKNPNYIRV